MVSDAAKDVGGLELFTAVAEHGSVASAAAVLGLAQASATERLDRLERRIGMRLLDRGPGGSTPTEQGSQVLVWARDLLGAAERFDDAVAELRRGPSKPVRIAASYTIAEHLLPGWLASFGRPLSGGVDLQVDNSTGVVEAVRAGRVDLGFVESGHGAPGLAELVFGEDALVPVAWPDHPWARRGQPLEARHLTDQPLVVREQGSGTREALETALAAVGLGPPTPAMQLGSNTAVIGAVLGRVAPAVISRLAVRSHLDTGSLVEVEVDGLDLHRPLHAIWRGPAPDGTAGALLDHVRRRSRLPSDRSG